MLKFSKDSNHHSMRVLKSSQGFGISIEKTVETLFGVQEVASIKNLSHLDAMKLRDYLNLSYPIDYSDVETIESEDVEHDTTRICE